MNDDETTEKTGYRKPPANSRFRPGQSGNPKGRPKGSLNVTTVLMKTLREKVVINENGKRSKITKLEAYLKQLVNKAASGDLRAITHLSSMVSAAGEQTAVDGNSSTEPINERDQKVLTDILKRYEKFTRENSDAETNDD
jgi:hypothetical protein